MTLALPLAALCLATVLPGSPTGQVPHRPLFEDPALTRSSVAAPPASRAQVGTRIDARARAWTPPVPQASDVGAAPAAGRWRSPVAPLRLRSGFRRPPHPWLAGHRGIDLATQVGQAVTAVGAGQVTYAGMVAGRPVLVIDHGTVRTTYEPVVARVEVGDTVVVGQQVGTIGRGTGHCGSGTCLHLGLRRGRDYLDPLLLLGRATARLRPW